MTTEFCDDCHGYTHMPWCPSYEQLNAEHHDAPAAPKRGEWRYVETRHSAEVAVNDNLRLRAHWTGTWDRDEIRTLMQGVVTEHNQHSTLIAQRERLIDAVRDIAIRSLRYCEEKYDHDDQARLNLEALLESVITTSEQERR